ncbi:hypothetical protein C8F04DRAFT_590093 [Mycena alexandri]|uniref:Uncharacterized protein n=1 Tax=Mycena alexandri TaxID=1745969 RepID=A0AAD6TG52_9AGAR|nr:hypothetical protein C8F04DRAFT_590093 [Mycena alexandri]
MSSQNIPPQLQLSIPPTSFKRSFEQFGFDLESPSTVPHSHEPIDGTSNASGSSTSTRGQDGDENRRKRARSASSLSDPEDRSSEASSSSTLSSFSASTSADSDSLSHSSSSQTAARRHLLLDLGLGRGLGSSVALGLGMAAAELQLGSSEPPPRIPTPELLDTEDVDMPDIDLSDFSRPEEHEEEPASPAEHVRRSVDRFNAFERHISALRSSSPPVIPLPSSITSLQAPPTLPPLPLVELGLDPEDGEGEDEHEHIPSTVTTNTTTSTPPRLDLTFPPTTSLSLPGPSSPRVATEESATQFRERLDSAIDGLGGGNLHFEAPILSPTDRPDDELDRHFQRLRESLATSSTVSNASGSSSASASASASRARPSVESPLFEWAPTALDWNITLNPSRASGSEAGQVPSLSPWRAHFRPPGAAAAAGADTAPDRSRYSPPYQPPRLYPRPASLAAPLSVPATTSSLDGLDVDLVDAYLDSVRANSTNTRAWESALDRARTMRVQREREREEERERERERTRERLRERERAREREREEESERERDHPWSLDSIWETTGGVESLSSARPRPWESLTLRTRREMEDESEVELELARRRALQRQMHQPLDRDRDRQRDEQHERGQSSSSISRAARYLESGLVDPRETPTSSSTVPPRERRLRPPSDTSNPFPVSWSSRRATRPTEDGPSRPPRLHRSRSSSQTREGVSAIDWLGQMEERDDSRTHLDLFDEWLNSEHPTPRSITPGLGASSSTAPYVEREVHTRTARVPIFCGALLRKVPLRLTSGGLPEGGSPGSLCHLSLRPSQLVLRPMLAHSQSRARPWRH